MTSAKSDRKPSPLTTLGALSWLVVLAMALATSWWSLYAVARHYGVPMPLAVGFSSIFDGAALILADLQRRYAETDDSGLVPRLLLIGTVAGSVALNRQHAVLAGYDWPGQLAFAAPAAVAIALFEVEMRWRHRQTLRDNGRVAEALPTLGRWLWTLHPAQSIRTLILVTRRRGKAVRQRELARIETHLRADLDALQTTEHSADPPDELTAVQPGPPPAARPGPERKLGTGQQTGPAERARRSEGPRPDRKPNQAGSPDQTTDDLLLDHLAGLSRTVGRMLTRPEAVNAVQDRTGRRPGSSRADRLREQAAQRAEVYVRTGRGKRSKRAGRRRPRVVPLDQSGMTNRT